MAQSVGCPTSAQVMISQFVGSSPTSDSVLTVQSLEPASDSVSPSHSAPPPLVLCLSKINKCKKKKLKDRGSRGGAERERERERIPSRFCAVSPESDVGLDLMNHEIMT